MLHIILQNPCQSAKYVNMSALFAKNNVIIHLNLILLTEKMAVWTKWQKIIELISPVQSDISKTKNKDGA